MKYINERILSELGTDWNMLINAIEETTRLLADEKVSQPVKPYLRFNDPKNRIIAMPAYVGGEFNVAGIKWIASFPDNIRKSIKRAHSILVLNDASTGAPVSFINTAVLSGIRTASVSGFVIKQYLQANKTNYLDCGIIGFGPIGQLHLQMLNQSFGDKIRNVYIYDILPIEKQILNKFNVNKNIIVCSSWEDVFEQSNLFITCTVSSRRYINLTPKAGGIYLNVSLRDFETDFLKKITRIAVDNWEEICRENTDIENAHLQYGLAQRDVLEMTDILDPKNISGLEQKTFMFNPMGMAIFDIAIAKYYDNLAVKNENYILLED